MSYRFYDDDGNFMDVGLKEARENGYNPSVTSILSIVNNPGITIWKVNTMKEACMSLALNPELAHLTDEEFDSRVSEDFVFRTTKAAELGTLYHDAIKEWFEYNVEPMYIPKETWKSFARLIEDNVINFEELESSFVHKDLKYAGTVDFYGTWGRDEERFIYIDWKTQATKNGKFRFYKNWCSQLAAYGVGSRDSLDKVDFANVVISTTEPGLVRLKKWNENELRAGWEAFLHARDLWRSFLGASFDDGEE